MFVKVTLPDGTAQLVSAGVALDAADAVAVARRVAPNGVTFEAMAQAPVLPFDDVAVKLECRRRILLVASETTQSNTTAAATTGWPREPDESARVAARSAYLDGVMWIYSMIDASRALIAAQDVTFKADAHWPQAPATAVALAARY